MAKYILSAFADEAAVSLGEQIEALREAGITCIEPRTINGHGIMDQSDEELAVIKEELTKAGIGLSSLGSPIGKYSITEDFEPHFRSFCRAVELAKFLGTPRIRLFSFFIPEGASPADYRDEVVARMKRMQAYAEKEGVILCHENEAKIYGEQPKEVADILAAVPGLRAIWDAANYILCDADPVEGYEVSRERAEYFHIKDAKAESGGLIVPCGDGEGRIGEILARHSKTTDATVYLTLEPHLNSFTGYGAIDDRNLAGKGLSFKDNRESFAFGAAALKETLRRAGFVEREVGIFTPAE